MSWTPTPAEACAECHHERIDHDEAGCHWRQHGALRACRCDAFISATQQRVAALPFTNRRVLACARHLNINPTRIASVDVDVDGGGHYVGLRVTIRIAIGRHNLNGWIRHNLPTLPSEWLEAFLKRHR